MKVWQTVLGIAIKFKYYGVKGAVRFLKDFVPSRIYKKRLRRFFIRSFNAYKGDPEAGITVIGDLSAKGSVYKVLRDFVFSLKETGIAYQTYDTCRKPAVPPEDVAEILTPRESFQLRRYTRIVTMFCDPLPQELGLDVTVIYFWEFTSAFLHAHPESLTCTSIVGMSDFNVKYFRSLLPDTIKVSKILYPFRTDKPCAVAVERMRTRYHLDDGCFVVFFNFAVSSSTGRKNPDGAMRAFAEAFPNEKNTRLVFKIFGADSHERELDRLKRLANSLGIADRLVVILDYLAQAEMFALTAICDTYLSLHRGEGFGLGIAEAMSLGKPVVVTGWSANTEFCNEDNSFLVPYSIEPVPSCEIDHIYLDKLEAWAEPDIRFAAKCLRRLYENPSLRKTIGDRAKESVLRQFSIENFKHSVEQFIGGVV